jgi:hypothetical protein
MTEYRYLTPEAYIPKTYFIAWATRSVHAPVKPEKSNYNLFIFYRISADGDASKKADARLDGPW